ncbi:MAG: hypothetical protein LBF69_00845 [Prevotellaceae bacterium]|jgi:hypothetical protein|nr:hypothetical protein [Prevotellaceae bacterium]
MENSLNLLEAARLYLPYRNRTGIDVGDIMRMYNNNINTKTVETMFETGTGLSGASSVYDAPRKTHRRNNKRIDTNYYYADLPDYYDWDITDAQAIMYNRYREIHRMSVVIRLLLFMSLVFLLVKIAKK